MLKKTQRNVKIDAARGLAIICVVLGHCGAPGTQVYYLFHMGAFLFISGYCLNEKNCMDIRSLRQYLGRKMLSLYLPFAVFCSLMILLSNGMIRIGILSDKTGGGFTCFNQAVVADPERDPFCISF